MEDAEMPAAEEDHSVRFFSRVAVISPHLESPKDELPRLGTKRISLNLSLSKTPKSPSATSPTSSGDKADFFGSARKSRSEEDEEEYSDFIPNPPRVLSLKMPTLGRRKRTLSKEKAGPSILAHHREGHARRSAPRPANAEACPMVDDVPDLPSGSTSALYRYPATVLAPASPAEGPDEEHLHDCCAGCQASYKYGLLPEGRYREHFSSAAKRKRERDSAAASAPVPGEDASSKMEVTKSMDGEESDAPVQAPQAHLVDELSRLRPGTESGKAAARRASLNEPEIDLPTLTAKLSAVQSESVTEEHDEEGAITTAPLRRRPASTSAVVAYKSVPMPEDTGLMRRRGTSLKPGTLPYGSFPTAVTKVVRPPSFVSAGQRPTSSFTKTISPVEEKEEVATPPTPLSPPIAAPMQIDDDDDDDDHQLTAPLAARKSRGRSFNSLPMTRVVPLSSLMAKHAQNPGVDNITEEDEEEQLPPMRKSSTTPVTKLHEKPFAKAEKSDPLRTTVFPNTSAASQTSEDSAESKRPKFRRRISALFSFGSSPTTVA